MKRALFAVILTVVGLVLLLTYETPAPPAVALPAPVGAGSSTPAASPPPAAAPPSSGAPPSSAAPPAEQETRTLVGQTIDTEQGPVQVQITMTGTTISDVTVLQYPNDGGRDTEINSFALPQLIDQALAVQSADIQMVSGATYTSEGFIASMQSALDQA